MLCPTCQKKLEKSLFYNVEADYCAKCLGIFFEADELRQAKDVKDKDLNWLDIELWKDETKFKISPETKLCSHCRIPLYEIGYGDSDIKVDICSACRGIWLDRGEFKKLIGYLKEKGAYEVLSNYFKNVIEEFGEVFTGPEPLKEEISDFLGILKLLNYKFATQYPAITKIISQLPK